MYQALFNTANRHPGVLDGTFLWDNWITSAELWASYWAHQRSYAIRDKPVEDVVRSAYAPPPNNPPEAVGAMPAQTLKAGTTSHLNVAPFFLDRDDDVLVYAARSGDTRIVRASMDGPRLKLHAVAPGDATVAVTAQDPDGSSATQVMAVRVRLTVSPPFTDHPLVPGVTPVRAVHFTELRTRVDAVRGALGLGRFAWTDPVLSAGVTQVRREHLLELRSALAAAYAAAERSAPSFTDPGLVARVTAIRAVHLMELRAAVVALE